MTDSDVDLYVSADLWTKSRRGNPWKFFELLLFSRAIEHLHNWYTSSDSPALEYGGHHYLEEDLVGSFDDDDDPPPELIKPGSEPWSKHLSRLLTKPTARVESVIRKRLFECKTPDEVRFQAKMIDTHLSEYEDHVSEIDSVPQMDEIISVLSKLRIFLASKVESLAESDQSESEDQLTKKRSNLSPTRNTNVGRKRLSGAEPEDLEADLRDLLNSQPNRFRHISGVRKGKPNVSQLVAALQKKRPATLGDTVMSSSTLTRRVRKAIEELRLAD